MRPLYWILVIEGTLLIITTTLASERYYNSADWLMIPGVIGGFLVWLGIFRYIYDKLRRH